MHFNKTALLLQTGLHHGE